MEHTLADELGQPWQVDIGRAWYLVDRIASALAGVHPALVPANVMIDEHDDVRLVTTAAPAAPYVPSGTLSERSNVYSLGIMLSELLGDHTEGAALVTACTRPDPISLADLRQRLQSTSRRHSVGAWHRAFEPRPIERELIASLREDGVRDVYADWLEQHGFGMRAKFLRGEWRDDAPRDDVGWRAQICNAVIATCREPACPRWGAMTKTSFDNVRVCTTCTRPVRYCATLAEVDNAQLRNLHLAADAALPDRVHFDPEAIIDVRAVLPSPLPQAPPAPPVVDVHAYGGMPRTRNILTRLFDLFRRR